VSEAAVLRIESLWAGYEPGLSIVRGASLEVGGREILAILGPNGAGKSTLVKAVAGLVPVSSGCIWLAGREITREPAHAMASLGLGFVPQTENVFTNLSVSENLELAAALQRVKRSRLDHLYAQFPDLARQRSLLAGRLSGGQRQMLAIARALINLPQVLMLDEPSAGLSPRLVAEVFRVLRDIAAQGIAIVLVEQNVKAALAIADRAAVLVEGCEKVVAPAAELAGDARIAELYLGRHVEAQP
jgi:branched-chain amino acid transport system ATP-binding protein